MEHRQLWHMKKGKCAQCGASGYRIVNDSCNGLSEWLRLAGQSFMAFIEEYAKEGRNIIHEYGCAKCFDLRKM